MLVYGDRSEMGDPRQRLRDIDEELRRVAILPDRLARHSTLTEALIEAGRVLQGVADAESAAAGCDHRSAAGDALGDYVMAIARNWLRSWDGGSAEHEIPPAPVEVALPEFVELKVPEGYAYYALYREAYVRAARSLRLGGPARVIGIRSIGTSLAAVVAAAIGAPRPVTVRPFGSPYRRRVAIAAELERELLAEPDAEFLIVDEGPGQSGSSFCSVADWLQERGVPEERIIFMPSHGGAPGTQASGEHRRRWARGRRAVADGDAYMPRLIAGLTRLLGPLEGFPEDISRGLWRKRLFGSEAEWPPVNPAPERRKFIVRAGGEMWLLRFAGFGEEGRRKLRRDRLLHSAGLVPEPLGLVHGFLVERWLETARPLPGDATPLGELARYIGTRARLLPARSGSGASLDQLLAMASRNIGLVLGNETSARLETWRGRIDAMERKVARVETDGRLDPHEWLRLPDGRLLKADAVDHCQGHDLVGCQDMVWDVAGASIEFDLDEARAAGLAGAAGLEAGRLVDLDLLEFMTLAYLAFRLGQAWLSMEACAGDQAEHRRFAAAAERYRRLIERRLNPAVRPMTRELAQAAAC